MKHILRAIIGLALLSLAISATAGPNKKYAGSIRTTDTNAFYGKLMTDSQLIFYAPFKSTAIDTFIYLFNGQAYKGKINAYTKTQTDSLINKALDTIRTAQVEVLGLANELLEANPLDSVYRVGDTVKFPRINGSPIGVYAPISGGGTTVTASNGLTKVGSDIQLGGTVTDDITIDATGHEFVVYPGLFLVDGNGTATASGFQNFQHFFLNTSVDLGFSTPKIVLNAATIQMPSVPKVSGTSDSALRLNPTTRAVEYIKVNGGGGATPTLQQVVDAGSTATNTSGVVSLGINGSFLNTLEVSGAALGGGKAYMSADYGSPGIGMRMGDDSQPNSYFRAGLETVGARYVEVRSFGLYTSKTTLSRLPSATSYDQVLPSASGNVVLEDNTATLTNKTISGSSNTLSNIAQSSITGLLTSLAGKQPTLSGTGFVKASGSTISYDNSTYLTGNQTISLSGDASGSGTTAIPVTVGRLLGADLPANAAGNLKSNGSSWSFDNTTYLPTSTASNTYLPLAGGTLTGGLTFNNGSMQQASTGQKMFATGSNTLFVYTGTSGINFTNQANTTTIATLSNTGAFNAAGAVTGANLSGTNTGDQTSVTGNAGTATALQTARTINGTSFDGTANITVTAAAGTLTGATLASGVTASSLTSVGTISGGTWQGGTIGTAYGGTGVISLGTGIQTWWQTPSSANLAAALTDETGTGSAVFSASPALTGSPTAPTAAAGDNSTKIATTAFVLANAGGSAGTIANQPYIVVKSADEIVNNSSTLQNDDHLAFSVAANTQYLVEMSILGNFVTATPDIKLGWTYPTGTTILWGQNASINNTSASAAGWMSNTAAVASKVALSVEASVLFSGTSVGNLGFSYTAIVSVGSTSGTLQMQWAQNTATAENTTMLKGSFIRYTKLQ